MYDVIIIGAGVTGCAIARELSRRERKIAVLERASDVCEGTSKANSGIAHAGYDAEPGSLKAWMNTRGSEMMESLSRELDFPYRRNGSLVLGFSEDDRPTIEALYEKGVRNGVEGLRILDGAAIRALEPNVSGQALLALYAPTGGIVDPFLLTVALAENACVNGAEFFFRTEVTGIERCGADVTGASFFKIHTAAGKVYETRAVVNAAGVYADTLHNMVSARRLRITPRKGEYILLDKKTGGFVNATVFQCPTAMGKGVLVTPTVHGNLLLGPTSTDIADKEGTDTTAAGLAEILAKAGLSAERLPAREAITSFAGLRAHEDGGDFVLEEAADAPGFFDAAGIESPGLTSAPAIGEYVAGLIQQRFPAPRKAHFQAKRTGIPSMALCDAAAKKRLIEKNPLYGNVVCRCELVTEGEIVDAIHRPVGATTLDGIKRRVRAGMGRCQAGFCTPKQMEILARELGVDLGEITKNNAGSELLMGKTKE